MLKKAILASGVASAMAASTLAGAATVYDQEGTKLDLYARIAMGIEGGGLETPMSDNGAEFVNVGSRLQLTGSHQISDDLRAFARVQWRFTGDERDRSSGFQEVRNSYIGLESEGLGTLMAGNYDSFYNSYVTEPFDVYVQDGYELGGGGLQARGDSLGYITPNLAGFTAFLSAKHYDKRGEAQNAASSEIVTQGGVRFESGPLFLALGYVDDEDGRAGGRGEMIYGATVAYAITDAISARLGYETQDKNFDTLGLGMTFKTGAWKFHADLYNQDIDGVSSDRTTWAAAAHYKLSSSLDFFVELNDADNDFDNQPNESDDLYYIAGARYHF
ncbi:MAG TPA: porin [Halomonas sp.]|nr:porin [Halomonas sp.]